MSMFLLGAVIGVAVICAAAFVLLYLRDERPWRETPQPLVPKFTPRRHPPRAITRITKDDLFWEIQP